MSPGKYLRNTARSVATSFSKLVTSLNDGRNHLHSPTHEDQLLAKISSFQNLDIEVSNDDPRSLNGNRDSFRFAYGNWSYSSQRLPWLDMNKIM